MTTLAEAPLPGERRRSIAAWSAALGVLVAAAALGFWGAGRVATVEAPYAAFLPKTLHPTRVGFTGPNPGAGTLSGALETASGLTGVPSLLLAERAKEAASQAGQSASAAIVQRSMLASSRLDGTGAFMGVALRLPEGLARVGYWFSGGGITWYEPPIIELPADPAPGTRWTSEGSLFGIYPYRLEGRVESGDDAGPGCVRTVTALRQQDKDGSWTTLNDVTTWCPGQGVVRSEAIDSGNVISLLDHVRWGQPTEATATSRLAPPPGATYDLPAIAQLVHPAVLLPGTIVVADEVSQDLVALSASSASVKETDALPQLAVSWIQHPGGSILGLASDGTRVVAATSSRMLMAFDVAGQLLWASSMGDAASGPAIFAGDLVVISTMNGGIEAFGRHDGVRRWQARMPDLIDAPIAVIPGQPTEADPMLNDERIIVADASGNLRLFDLDGTVRWSVDDGAPVVAIGVLGDGAVVIGDRDGGLVLLSGSQGEPTPGVLADVMEPVWQRDVAGSIAGPPVLVGGQVIIPTADALVCLDRETGAMLWTRSDLPDARVVDWRGRLMGTSGSSMFELDGMGNVLALEPFGDDDLVLRRLTPIAVEEGVLVVSDDGLVRTWAGVDD